MGFISKTNCTHVFVFDDAVSVKAELLIDLYIFIPILTHKLWAVN